MDIKIKIGLKDFQPTSGGKITKEVILLENKDQEFDFLIEELYPAGLTDNQLNDLLWFEPDWLFNKLGI